MANSMHEFYDRPERGAAIQLHPHGGIYAPVDFLARPAQDGQAVSAEVASEINAVVIRSIDAIRAALGAAITEEG